LGDNADIVLLSDVIYEESMAKNVLKNAWKSLAENVKLFLRQPYGA